MEKTNKCLVRFVCVGYPSTCENHTSIGIMGIMVKSCVYNIDGNCTNKQAQIKALQDEGFEVNN